MVELERAWIEEAGRESPVRAVCHASSLLPLPGGELLAAWFAGSAEGEPDVGVFLSRRRDDGSWTRAERVDRESGEAHWNPVLASRRDGGIVLFYKVGDEIAEWRTMLRTSRDRGSSWSAAAELVGGDRGGRGPVRTKVLALTDGTWLAGASLERGAAWRAFVDRSEDEGATWSAGSLLSIDVAQRDADGASSGIAVSAQSFKGRGVIQPSLWAEEDGSCHALLRSTEGRVYRTDSRDGGRTWSRPEKTGLPNNNSGLDVVYLGERRLVLAHNPVGENWGSRTPLVLSFSEDDGSTWERALVLEEGPGEFSYPALALRGDELFASWTRDRKAIAVAKFYSRGAGSAM
jgi:Predicted neuraminidase (sialidase)